MKHIITLSILAAGLLVTSCGKKITASFSGVNQNQAYHTKTKAAETTEAKVEENAVVEASLYEEKTIDAKELKKVESFKKVAEYRENLKNADKSTLTKKQSKLLKKLDNKLEKLEKKSQNKGGISSLMKTGIIIAAIGLLVLILTAAGIFGGISGLFWALGGIAFLAGLIIILYDLLQNNI
jgi:uncharacterized membrane protein